MLDQQQTVVLRDTVGAAEGAVAEAAANNLDLRMAATKVAIAQQAVADR